MSESGPLHKRVHREAAKHILGDLWGWECVYCDIALVCPCVAPFHPIARFNVYGVLIWPRLGRVRLATLDHVDHRIRGRARDSLGNLRLACDPCNTVKGDRGVEYLMRRIAEGSMAA